MRRIVAASLRTGMAFRLLLASLLVIVSMNTASADEGHVVRFDAVVVKGAPPINGSMVLQVWSLQGRKAVRMIAERDSAPADVVLAPGNYRVVAEYKTARTVRDIAVTGPEDTRKTINLKAGEIGLELLQQVGGAPVQDSVLWEVRRYKRGTTAGAAIAQVSQASPSLLLREGWYEIVATHGDVRTDHVIEVSAGQRFNYSLVMK